MAHLNNPNKQGLELLQHDTIECDYYFTCSKLYKSPHHHTMKKIAVITPYYKEPIEVPRKCHESVLSQSAAATHFLIAAGFPQAELGQWNIKHISLTQRYADNSDTPRRMGGLFANMEGSRNIQKIGIYTTLNKIQS